MAFPVGWTRKCIITIPDAQVQGNNSNFPILITQNNLPVEMLDGGANSALNGGGDVRFSEDSAGATRLDLEIVTFVTGGTPDVEMWVKLPTLNTGAAKEIYVWYNKAGEVQPAVTATFGRNAVWTDYSFVLHLGSGSVLDSTGNHGVDTFGSPVVQDNMLFFDGIDDYLSIPDHSNLRQTNTATLTAVFRSRSDYFGDHHYFFSKRQSGQTGQGWRYSATLPAYTKFGVADYPFTTSIPDTVDRDFVAFTVDGSSASFHKNGSFVNSLAISTTAGTTTSPVIIGRNVAFGGGLGSDFTKGHTGELRFSNTVAQSSDWLTTEYNNQSSPATFSTAGTPEAVGGGVSLIIEHAVHNFSSGSLTFAQVHGLSPASIGHSFTSDNVISSLGISVMIHDATHGITSDGAGLTQGQTLTIGRGIHIVTNDTVDFAQLQALIIQNTTHGIKSDVAGVFEPTAFTPNTDRTYQALLPHRTASPDRANRTAKPTNNRTLRI